MQSEISITTDMSCSISSTMCRDLCGSPAAIVEFVALACVQSGGRLIETKKDWFGTHCARDFQPALIAIGQIACRVVGARGQADAVEPVTRAFDGFRFGAAEAGRADQSEKRIARSMHQRIVLRHHQVFERGHAREQADVLEGARDFRDLGNAVVENRQQEFAAVSNGRIMPVVGETGDAIEDGGLPRRWGQSVR